MSDDPWELLRDEVIAELADPVHANKSHYKKATYAAGCRGPLCRKAERDEGRRRSQRRAEAAGREYKPEPRTPLVAAMDAWLDEQIHWHLTERARLYPPPQHCASCACRGEKVAV